MFLVLNEFWSKTCCMVNKFCRTCRTWFFSSLMVANLATSNLSSPWVAIQFNTEPVEGGRALPPEAAGQQVHHFIGWAKLSPLGWNLLPGGPAQLKFRLKRQVLFCSTWVKLGSLMQTPWNCGDREISTS